MTTLEPPPAASTNGLGEPTATVELPPDPRVNAALGLQHSLETAVAELVDNSIDAGAHGVWIRFIVDDAHVREIVIADDGRGMSRGAIRKAFILGARQQYAEGRLGHYGVGMAASAFSQAEQLTVISRSTDDHPVAMTARRTAAEAITADVYSQEDAAPALHADDVPVRAATGTAPGRHPHRVPECMTSCAPY